MNTSVYNIVWADDEIDDLLDEQDIADYAEQGFHFVGLAHNGEELASFLEKVESIDAVIVDANFNESHDDVGNDRDVSGLSYARFLYIQKFNRKIPFFLFTGRTDELLEDKYKDNLEKFKEDFPRHKRWFHKNGDEQKAMFDAIKQTVDEMRTPQFIVRNRYEKELKAAKQIDDTTYNFILDFLMREYNNDLDCIGNPFNDVRKIIDAIFGKCKALNIIPPIDAMNGIADYFQYANYSPWDKDANKRVIQYKMLGNPIMPKPLAFALKSFIVIAQDGSHRNDELNIKVDEYFNTTRDILFLRSVVYILLDVIKWFTATAEKHPDDEINELTLWEKVN